jgi:hypothetical protein
MLHYVLRPYLVPDLISVLLYLERYGGVPNKSTLTTLSVSGRGFVLTENLTLCNGNGNGKESRQVAVIVQTKEKEKQI